VQASPAAGVGLSSAAGNVAGTAGTSAAGLSGVGTDILAGTGVTPTAGAVGPTEAATPAATSGLGNFFSNNKGLLTSLGLPLAAVGAAPFVSKLINPVPQQGALEQLAQQESSLASQQQQLSNTLTNPLVTGQLPPQAQQQVQNAVNDAISTTKARYANLGLTGSTAEADAISNIQNQSTAITFQIAQQMAQTGEAAIGQASNALGLQDQIYSQLMQAQVQQDTALQQAIARFAAASAIGNKPAAQAVNALT